jgi:hypothetical protein
LLSAYFDKSADEPIGITSVAEYVATLEEWCQVEAEWKKALTKWSLDQFHFSGIEWKIGKENASSCRKYFEDIIVNSSLNAIGAALLNEHWHRDDWGRDKTPKLSTPYAQCLDMALQLLGEHTQKHFPGESVTVFCNKDDASDSCIWKTYNGNSPRYNQFIALTIGSDKNFIPLQCADLGAWKLRKSWLDIDVGKAEDLPWGGMPQGQEGRGMRTSFWSLRPGTLLLRAISIKTKQYESP